MNRQSQKQEVVREVVDTNDVVWRVKEVRVWTSAGKQVNSLIAERAGGFRKLWSYPSDWADLNDLELGTLINDPVPMEPSGRGADAGAEPGEPAEPAEPADPATAAAAGAATAPSGSGPATNGGPEPVAPVAGPPADEAPSATPSATPPASE